MPQAGYRSYFGFFYSGASAPVPVKASGFGVIEGAGILEGAGSTVRSGSGVVSGDGVVEGAGSIVTSGSGVISGAGILEGAGSTKNSGFGVIEGAGILEGSATSEHIFRFLGTIHVPTGLQEVEVHTSLWEIKAPRGFK